MSFRFTRKPPTQHLLIGVTLAAIVAIGSTDAFALANFPTLAGGALLIAPHLASIYLFALLALVTLVIHHCGYALPWAPWSVPHDWHHYRVREVFGPTGLIDAAMGTDQEFRTLRDRDER